MKMKWSTWNRWQRNLRNCFKKCFDFIQMNHDRHTEVGAVLPWHKLLNCRPRGPEWQDTYLFLINATNLMQNAWVCFKEPSTFLQGWVIFCVQTNYKRHFSDIKAHRCCCWRTTEQSWLHGAKTKHMSAKRLVCFSLITCCHSLVWRNRVAASDVIHRSVSRKSPLRHSPKEAYKISEDYECGVTVFPCVFRDGSHGWSQDLLGSIDYWCTIDREWGRFSS